MRKKLFILPLSTIIITGLLAVPTMAAGSVVKIAPDMYKTVTCPATSRL